ncbi:hypothetical protein CWR48_13935 [Oceanobacillus arenosus]|uniref:Uncharacterized protein n=1 Tax=Oceanobacillus arenosus TaxID=1229153 RepID=A0A3D8PPI8_9BACI|nr:hypothetical protein [Oceanobacillus arenosus]RDW17612.1 hypothetical protein CWR48_13935 [Oceanobacillus arenosus]
MNEQQIDDHLNDILHYQKLINQLGDDMKIQRIELLSKQLVFIGKLAATFSENYKRVYATRKRVHAEAYISATKNKTAVAELAIVDLREEEAEAYGNMKRWNNAFESTKEEINAIKYKVKIDVADGSSQQGGVTS